MNRKFFSLTIQLILTLVLFSGCQHSVKQPQALYSSTTTSSIVVSPESMTAQTVVAEPSAMQMPFTLTPSQTTTLTFTPEPSATPKLFTSTPNRSRTPTPGITPTLSEAQIAQLVIDMLANNGGCELPCWWGFVPGKASWETVADYFSSKGISFRLDRSIAGMSIRWVNLHIWKENFQNFHMGISFIIDKNVAKIISVVTYVAQGDYYIFDDSTYAQYMERYTLSKILSTLGQPTEVLVTAVLGSTGGVVPDYEIILFYPNRGVMVSYNGMRKENTDFYRLCPTETHIDLYLWSPEEKVNIADIYLSDVSNDSIEDAKWYFGTFLPLKDATGINVDSFYVMFQNNASQICLDTPAYLWKK